MLWVLLLLAMWLKGQISHWWYEGFSPSPSLRDAGRAAEEQLKRVGLFAKGIVNQAPKLRINRILAVGSCSAVLVLLFLTRAVLLQ